VSVRAHTAPYSFGNAQKSKQKNAASQLSVVPEMSQMKIDRKKTPSAIASRQFCPQTVFTAVSI